MKNNIVWALIALTVFGVWFFYLGGKCKLLPDQCPIQDDQICHVKRGFTHEVLPIFKDLIEDFKKEVPSLLKENIDTKDDFVQLVKRIKEQSNRIYHFPLEQHKRPIDIVEFINCMDQHLVKERQKRLDESEGEAEDIKNILMAYIKKIEQNINLFQRFKIVEKDIRFEIEKLNDLLTEREIWLKQTDMTHHGLIESVSQQFKLDVAKILDLNTSALNQFPEFE
jgi:hypothetical protein